MKQIAYVLTAILFFFYAAPGQSASIFLGTGDNFVITQNNTTVHGGPGNETITISDATTGVRFNQNVEQIRFFGASNNYGFKQKGNQIFVYAGGALVVSGPIQGDSDGTLLSFSDSSGSALLSNGIMSLGGITLSTNAVNIISLPGSCTYSISPSSDSFMSSGGTVSVLIMASSSSCAWTASDSPYWVSLSPSSGTGSGAVTITATANTGAARSGSVTLAGKTYIINQAAADSYPDTTITIDGEWRGSYTWNCDGKSGSSNLAMILEQDEYGNISGEISYLGDSTNLTDSRRGVDPKYSDFGFSGLTSSPSGMYILLGHLGSNNFVGNTFSGQILGNKITGTTLNGDSQGGCSAAYSSAGTFEMTRYVTTPIDGEWRGSYTWNCDGKSGSSSLAMILEQDEYGNISGEISYLGDSTNLTDSRRGVDPKYSDFGLWGLTSSPSGMYILLGHLGSNNFVGNTFSGQILGNKITGTTLNGDSHGGCSAAYSSAGTFEVTRYVTTTTVTNSLGMTFVPIRPGTFMMGSPADEPERDVN